MGERRLQQIRRPARTFFGEPAAVGLLALTEAWERFSFYGMTAILVLYMDRELLQPGHIEAVAGFTALRTALEGLAGPLSPLALASQIFGLYTGFAYFTPLIGGWLADRVLGRRRAVLLGALLMSAGHLAMSADATFLVALVLLVVGCGLLKGNISVQLGALYRPDDAVGRTRGFGIFSVGINLGAIAGPLLIGYWAVRYGYHTAFVAAGLFMLAGCATYAWGYRMLPDDRGRQPRTAPIALSRRERRRIIAILAVTGITVFQSVAFFQNSNINLIWIDEHVDLGVAGLRIPVAWFNSVDSIASVAFVPPLFVLWRWQAARRRAVDELARIAQGAWLAAAANLLLALGCLGGNRVPVLYPLLYDVLLGIAFLYYWPSLLALVSRAAPPNLQATLMGTAFLSWFFANGLVGWIGGYYEKMTPARFWLLHAGISSIGALLAAALHRPLTRMLDPPA